MYNSVNEKNDQISSGSLSCYFKFEIDFIEIMKWLFIQQLVPAPKIQQLVPVTAGLK